VEEEEKKGGGKRGQQDNNGIYSFVPFRPDNRPDWGGRKEEEGERLPPVGNVPFPYFLNETSYWSRAAIWGGGRKEEGRKGEESKDR